MSRDETVQRPTDWSPDRHQTNKHHTHGTTAQFMPQHSERIQQRTAPQPEFGPGHHPTHGQTLCPPSAAEYQHSGPAVPYLAIPGPVSTVAHPEPPEVQPRRKASADQIYAAHREARSEARQALKEEAHTEGLLKSRKAVLPSEIRRRERSVDDTHRGRHEDMDWQTYSPERRRRSRDEEDWDWDRPRERGRERTVGRIRERGREHISICDSQQERAFRSSQSSHMSGCHAPWQHQSSEPQGLQQEPPKQQQHDRIMTEHGAHIQLQDDHRLYQYEQPRQPQDALRPQQSQQLQESELRKQEPPKQQRDGDLMALRQQQDPSGHRSLDSAIYLQKGSSLSQAKHRSNELSGGPKPKTRTRSMSDIGISQHSAIYHKERVAAGRGTVRAGHPSGIANGEMGTLDTRVSVAQLRHSYLENANRKPEL